MPAAAALMPHTAYLITLLLMMPLPFRDAAAAPLLMVAFAMLSRCRRRRSMLFRYTHADKMPYAAMLIFEAARAFIIFFDYAIRC